MLTHRRNSNSQYGRGRGYRSGRGGMSNRGGWRNALTVPEPPSPPLGSILAAINRSDLIDNISGSDGEPQINDCRLAGSYNWLNRATPTMMVPGMPPAWTPLSTPTKLQEDNGSYFRDQNAARYSSYPMQPAIEAILKQNPHFPVTDIDIVACGSTMGNLLRFARNVDREKKFRILIEAVGSTVFILRRENSPTQLIPDVRGYGHTFPEAYTTWDREVRGSESHQRILEYDFAGLRCLVRFEGDGYHPHLVHELSKPERMGRRHTDDDNATQQLLASFEANTLSTHSPEDRNLTAQDGGMAVSQAAIFDLKTRSIRRKDDDILGGELSRLWISQIPNFVLAFHRFGVFEEIQTIDVREKVKKWETEQKRNLRAFANLLRSLISLVHLRSDGRLEVVHEGNELLELREVAEDVLPRALPDILKARWVEGDEEKNFVDEVKEGYKPPENDVPGWGEGEWDSESELDYTACSASECGYCGHCKY